MESSGGDFGTLDDTNRNGSVLHGSPSLMPLATSHTLGLTPSPFLVRAPTDSGMFLSPNSDVLEAGLISPAPPLFQPPPLPSRNTENGASTGHLQREVDSTLLGTNHNVEAALEASAIPMQDLQSDAEASGTLYGSNIFAGVSADDKKKRNPAYLNIRPRFWELNNDLLLGEVWGALIKAQSSWLSAREVQALLEFCKAVQLGARAPTRPPSGTVFYFDSRAGEYFRRDGYDYIKKRGSGISVREDHVKLRQGQVAVVYASYVHSAEWIDPQTKTPLFHRRSYWLVDSDEKDRGVVVHYLAAQDSNVEPATRPHDMVCECILCCLKRENSRPDRPGESLEQILSRAQHAALNAPATQLAGGAGAQKKKRTPMSTVDQVSESASASLLNKMRKKRKASKKRNENGDHDGENDEDGNESGGNENGGYDSETEKKKERTVPKRAAAPSQPMIDGSSSSDEEEMRVTRNNLTVQTSFPAPRQNNYSEWDDVLPSEETIPLSPSAGHSFTLPDHDLEQLGSLLTPLHSARASNAEMDFGSESHLDSSFLLSSSSNRIPPAITAPTWNTTSVNVNWPSPRQMEVVNESLARTLSQSQEVNESLARTLAQTVKPTKPKPATRFDFVNLVVADVSPERLVEGARVIVVIGMGRMPETLNHRTWTEKVFPKLSVWFGEYRVPHIENVALGVVRFLCPPMFRQVQQQPPAFECRIEGRQNPIAFSSPIIPSWEVINEVGGSSLKRVRPSFATPLKDGDLSSPVHLVNRRFSSRSPIGGGAAEGKQFFEEEEEEEEELDQRATNMVERVVRLMTASGGGTASAEIINEVSADNGFNFLHTAVFCGASVEVIQMLLNHGADPNVKTRNPEGNTSLHLSCEQGNVPVTKALIHAGANSQVLNDQGFSPMEMIMSREESESDAEMFALLGGGPTQPMSPMRSSGTASPRPQSTPARAQSQAPAIPEGQSHMVLLREALSSLSLKEQYTLAVAVGSESTERKRRSGSVASVHDVAPVLSSRVNEEEEERGDDVAQVVTENQSSVIHAALGEINKKERALLDAEARKIQSNVRAWILRKQYQEIREATKKVQALAKGHLARRHFRELREKASATLVIQKSLRAHIKAKKSRQQTSSTSPSGVTMQGLSRDVIMRDERGFSLGTNGGDVKMAPQEGRRLSVTSVGGGNQERRFSVTEHDERRDSSMRLNERRFSVVGGAVGSTQSGGPMQDPAHVADEFILSSDDLFDVNMREEHE